MKSSQDIAELAAALALAQATIEGAAKDSVNPFHKARYADLASVWKACRGPLTENGLAVVQAPCMTESGRMCLETILMHKSGQWVSGEMVLPEDLQTPQQIGSAITYFRRYGLSAMTSVCPEDDDGEAAHGRGPMQQQGQRREPSPPARKPVAKPTATTPAATTNGTHKAPVKADARIFHRFVADGVEHAIKAFRADFPDAPEPVNSYAVSRHALDFAVAKGFLPIPGRTPDDAEVHRMMSDLWKMPEVCPALRKEIAAFLAREVTAARDKATLEEQGDPDLDEVAPAEGREPGIEG